MRLALLARTGFLAVAFVWMLSWTWGAGAAPPGGAVAIIGGLIAIGALQLVVLGGRADRPWFKFVVYGADMAALCAAYVFVPLSSGGDVAQHLAFRVYGAHFLIAPVALSTLSLSGGLVLWTGGVGAICWWSAFWATTRKIEAPLSWSDLSPGASAEAYEALILARDFTGLGNRVDETAILLLITGVLSLAVARARKVFLAQVSAEEARESASRTLGRYVPSGVADELLRDGEALRPRVRGAVALVLDVADFSAFAAAATPEVVIRTLNDFLAAAETEVRAAGGVVISFTGDGLLAAFNTPIAVDDPERAALDAARRLVAVASGSSFRVRVGVASGELASGSVGSAERRAFTVYGDAVNRAARLEALAKEEGAAILTDARVAGADPAAARRLGPRTLRGVAEDVDIYAFA